MDLIQRFVDHFEGLHEFLESRFVGLPERIWIAEEDGPPARLTCCHAQQTASERLEVAGQLTGDWGEFIEASHE